MTTVIYHGRIVNLLYLQWKCISDNTWEIHVWHRDHSGYGFSQRESALCNAVSHWLSPCPKWSLQQLGTKPLIYRYLEWCNFSWFTQCFALLHDRPWIKSISNELDITFTCSHHNCLVIVTSSPIDCDVINRTWSERVGHGDDVWRSSFIGSFMDSLCHVRNKIMYVHLWRTVYALTRVLFCCLFPSLLRNSGNKHQNNPLVSA